MRKSSQTPSITLQQARKAHIQRAMKKYAALYTEQLKGQRVNPQEVDYYGNILRTEGTVDMLKLNALIARQVPLVDLQRIFSLDNLIPQTSTPRGTTGSTPRAPQPRNTPATPSRTQQRPSGTSPAPSPIFTFKRIAKKTLLGTHYAVGLYMNGKPFKEMSEAAYERIRWRELPDLGGLQQGLDAVTTYDELASHLKRVISELPDYAHDRENYEKQNSSDPYEGDDSNYRINRALQRELPELNKLIIRLARKI
ncbi:MAG: hypothetical protein ACYC7E_18850 [Armatimonadota bacterium]